MMENNEDNFIFNKIIPLSNGTKKRKWLSLGKLNDYEASAIAKETYKRNKNEIVIINDVRLCIRKWDNKWNCH